MSPPNLLVTGVTGFIGFKVLLNALEEGYTVRAAVRSIAQSKFLASHPKIIELDLSDKLSFVEVPDFTRDGAYDQALKGVTYVIHLAAPLPAPSRDPQTGIYEPTIKSVTTLLHSALKEPSIKKLVITFSVFANIPFPSDGREITAESRLPDLSGPFDGLIPAYNAGKIGALNATERFVNEHNPPFAAVKIMPGLAFGRDDRALTVNDMSNGTNGMLLSIITGKTAPPFPAGVGHVADIAKVHLLALKEGVDGSFGVTRVNVWDDAWPIVKKHFPKAVASGIFTQGSQPTIPINWNAHQTEVTFGFDFKSYEDIVVDAVGQYLELSGKEKA
ncbi:putative cinnamoyl-CoA reductase [Hypomontagnella submonticulosa]|nr:putative cinnamoyl-CoA reductase [Hypomontagnella submonticulosa]